MKKTVLYLISLLLLGNNGSGSAPSFEEQQLQVGGFSIVLKVPSGMMVEYVASLNGPRFITKGPDEELIVGSRGGEIYRLKHPYTQVESLVSLSGYVHSTVYNAGKLYVAETGGIWSAPYAGAGTFLQSGDFTRIAELPIGGHSSRTIVKGPDSRLYIGLGISGNCSDEYLHDLYPFERRRGGVFVMDSSGGLEPFSSGLRNPIGLAFHPQTDVLSATNAGSDNLGYDRPPEVLAVLSQGSFHGMPWFQYYDGSFRDGECIETTSPRSADEATVPAALFPARSTPEGIVFLQGSTLGQKFDSNAAVAIHGSWATQPGKGLESRRSPGLSLVVFEDSVPVGVENLISGFQRSDGSRFARPCGVAVGGDGHLYFTSDGGEVVGLFRLVPRSTEISTVM